MEDTGSSFEWKEIPDLTASSDEEIEGLLEALVAEETEISYRRRVVQGRIDLLRTELVRRGKASVSPQDLAKALLYGPQPRGSGMYGDGESVGERG